MKGLLLDTHIFLWWAKSSSKLPADINDYINRHRRVYLSSVVAWEVEIKQAKGTLIGESFDWPAVIADKQLISLPVSFEHVMALRQLPAIHKDPFDRLLLAQAKSEELQLATHDGTIWQYPDVSLLKVR
jgi:PIN domain nuclease of toxin-antitoxin system